MPDATRAATGVELSVVMPVHNALPYLDAAVESMIGQTFRDFEFVILDDGSTDGSTDRLRDWADRDARIRLLHVEENLGPALSSQRVAREASAPIVARMDADDVSYPDRLESQLELLRRNPDVGVVGSLCDIIDAGGRRLRGPEAWRLTRKSWFVPFAHGALMYRRALFDAVGGYRKECEYWEDQDLIARMRTRSEVLVIPRALYQVRQSAINTRLVSDQGRLEQAMDLAYRSVERLKQGGDYEDLLRIGGRPAKVDPRVFISLGSMALWANANPRIFGRLIRRGKLAFNVRTITALVWAAWASASPASLRAFLRLLLLAKNSFASGTLHGDRPVLWAPPGKMAALRTGCGGPEAT